MTDPLSRLQALAASIIGGAAIVIVEAPAGFGKTSFLRLLARDQAHVTWLACRLSDELGHARLEDRRGPLIIDEPERLSAPARTTLLAWALERASGAAPVWVATRRLADLTMARCLANEDTRVVRAEQLLLSGREVEQLCARQLSRSQARTLHAITRGWPALTLLLRRWLEDGGLLDAPELWFAQSGAAAYVEQEVLASVAAPVRAALPLAGVLAAVPLAMAQEIAPDLEPARGLVALAASMPGLVTIAHGACRLHPILQIAAADALAAMPTDERRSWRLRAADWLAGHGELVAAGRMAAGAGAPERIVTYMRNAGGLQLWVDGCIEQVGELTALAGADRIDADPHLRLLRCVRKLKDGRVLEAEQLFASACVELPDHRDTRQQTDFVRSALAVYGCRTTGEALPAGFAGEADDATGLWGSLGATIGLITCIQAADFERAQVYLRIARDRSRTTGPSYNLAFLSVHEAELALARGALSAARRAIDQARRRWRGAYAHDRGLETVIAATTAQLDFEADCCGAARRQLRLVQHRMPDAEAWLDIYIATYEPHFRLVAGDEGLAAALAGIAVTCATLVDRGLPRVADLLEALGICLAGERALADPTVLVPRPRMGVDRDIADWSTWHERELFWLANAYHRLATGPADDALAPLEALRGHARAKGLRRSELRAALVLVAALERTGCEAEADEMFAQALAIAGETGMRRALVEFGGPEVARRLRQRPEVSARHGDKPPDPSESQAASRLTPRERDVLRAVRLGGSDKVVARRVGLSEHGVRFHLKNMFRKLAVRDRVSLIGAVEADTP